MPASIQICMYFQKAHERLKHEFSCWWWNTMKNNKFSRDMPCSTLLFVFRLHFDCSLTRSLATIQMRCAQMIRRAEDGSETRATVVLFLISRERNALLSLNSRCVSKKAAKRRGRVYTPNQWRNLIQKDH